MHAKVQKKHYVKREPLLSAIELRAEVLKEINSNKRVLPKIDRCTKASIKEAKDAYIKFKRNTKMFDEQRQMVINQIINYKPKFNVVFSLN